ncbi:MAG: hypothetical protein Q7U31_11300, partial [Anaerolineaceae bacterium]|nr:hypothetical protein [Anaerolineaceae bacterium]
FVFVLEKNRKQIPFAHLSDRSGTGKTNPFWVKNGVRVRKFSFEIILNSLDGNNLVENEPFEFM